MKTLNLFSLVGQQLAIRRQKIKTLQQLRELNEECLIDIGISSALLRQGVAAYPWTMESSNADSAPSYNNLLAFNTLYSTALNPANQDFELRHVA